MEALIAIVVVLAVLSVMAQRINARYETRAPADGASPDDAIERAWEEFGADDPPDVAHARLDALSRTVDIGAVTRTLSLARYAVMAARAQRSESLLRIADRAVALDGACGDTRSIRALAEALAGDDIERAHAAILDAQTAVAGCSKCNSTMESRLLAEELAVAVNALEERDEAPAHSTVAAP